MQLPSAFAVLLLSLSSLGYAAIGPVANLYVANQEISPDGFSRSAVLAGSSHSLLSMPGPLISGNKGDRFLINVINSLNDPSMLTTTSIHWHGIFQQGSSWADGAVGVTQCPITPGKSFKYQFSAPNQPGTFWYHSHHSTQYCDGLRGPLVIYDPNDPYKHLYDVDNESTIISLADWYHTPSLSAGSLPTPDSTLINGRGRYVGGPAVPLTVLNVKRFTRYRFRLISMSCDPYHTFSIDRHMLTIIEVDGVLVAPHVVDSIDIFPGQRYSFILSANQPVDNYWVRANPSFGSMGFDSGINSAILRYQGAPAKDPGTLEMPSGMPLVEADLVSLQNPLAPGLPIPGGADVTLNLDITFNDAEDRFYINGNSFVSPTVPVLLQMLDGPRKARDPRDLPTSGNVIVLPRNKVIELSIPSPFPDIHHPFHLHGQNFAVVRSAGSTTYDYTHPVRRDVTSIGKLGDNVTIRFTTDNPGPWILHCHVNWHLQLGFGVVFVSDFDKKAHQPDAWHDLCPTYNDSGLQ